MLWYNLTSLSVSFIFTTHVLPKFDLKFIVRFRAPKDDEYDLLQALRL